MYYVAFQWQDYVDNPIEIFFTRNGGLAIYGGLIGGDWRCFLYASSFHFYMDFLDIAAPSVILAQAIGRWGNFMNHEAYGRRPPDNFRKSSFTIVYH